MQVGSIIGSELVTAAGQAQLLRSFYGLQALNSRRAGQARLNRCMLTRAALAQKAGDRGSLARTSGGYAIVVAHNPDSGVTRIKLPSGSKKVSPSLMPVSTSVHALTPHTPAHTARTPV